MNYDKAKFLLSESPQTEEFKESLCVAELGVSQGQKGCLI